MKQHQRETLLAFLLCTLLVIHFVSVIVQLLCIKDANIIRLVVNIIVSIACIKALVRLSGYEVTVCDYKIL